MRVDWDVPIPMDDDVVLRADVFCPEDGGAYPTLLSCGPYAKGLPFQTGYPSAWAKLANEHPDVTAGSSNAYQNWEVLDPEKWVPEGYTVVRVDSRGCGRSPGFVDHFSARETWDFHTAVEWAAAQPWSDGNVGLSGVSYFAMNQWLVAATRPPHLRAICVWEGATDFYRDATHHGGILCTFWRHWYDKQIKTVQYGVGEKGPRNPVNGLLVCGDETLAEEELRANRIDFGAVVGDHRFFDEFYAERTPDWSEITVPVLSAGNWGGQGLHLRGNIEGFLRVSSRQKWLELHGEEHWTSYYTDYGRAIQLQFFDHFLKGADNGWDARPPVQLQVRHLDGTFTERFEHEWPIARTDWRDEPVRVGCHATGCGPVSTPGCPASGQDQRSRDIALIFERYVPIPPIMETPSIPARNAVPFMHHSSRDLDGIPVRVADSHLFEVQEDRRSHGRHSHIPLPGIAVDHVLGFAERQATVACSQVGYVAHEQCSIVRIESGCSADSLIEVGERIRDR